MCCCGNVLWWSCAGEVVFGVLCVVRLRVVRVVLVENLRTPVIRTIREKSFVLASRLAI